VSSGESSNTILPTPGPRAGLPDNACAAALLTILCPPELQAVRSSISYNKNAEQKLSQSGVSLDGRSRCTPRTTGYAMRRFAPVLLVAILLLAIMAFEFLRHLGQFRDITPHFAGTCKAIPLAGSAEDIQVDRGSAMAYLSVLDRRALYEGKDVTGTIIKVDLKAAHRTRTPAVAGTPEGFRPHGLSLFTDSDGQQRLFVINHPAGKPHTVEIFERAEDGTFEHSETITNPWLLDPNAIVAVGPRQFYVVNTFGSLPGLRRAIEFAVRLASASIVYYDGDVMREVAEPVALGTGIAASADGGRVYVSEANAHRLRVYTRNSATGDLELFQNVKIFSAGDNLSIAEDGAIWVAAHPRPIQLMRHLRDPGEPSPTQVLRIAADPQTEDRISEIYMNDGSEISAGSVAAVLGKRMLIGSVTEHKIMECSLPWVFRDGK
jgi:arylesterase / paraoxonase